jgi:transcriptional regulator with XRE-family HTH domain
MEQRIRAMRAEGFSIREIARELGVSRMRVHRVLMSQQSPAVPTAAVAGSTSVVDAVVGPLSERDLDWLGLSAAEAAGGLSALDRYRLTGRRAAWAYAVERGSDDER